MSKAPDVEVAELVGMYNMCEVFHALPRAGGLLDQDQLLMRKFEIVQRALAEKQERIREEQQAQTGKGRR